MNIYQKLAKFLLETKAYGSISAVGEFSHEIHYRLRDKLTAASCNEDQSHFTEDEKIESAAIALEIDCDLSVEEATRIYEL